MYEAAFEGCWWKAKSILKIHKGAATHAITENGNTILHVAVEMGHNYFIEKLLELLNEEDTEKPNHMGQTALHIAAVVGNEYAAQLLVQKRKQLLVIEDNFYRSPFDIAVLNGTHISAYLFKSLLSSGLSPDPDPRDAFVAVCAAINAKQYGELQGMVTLLG
ncbi:putative ankyrin repeat-containing domain-containing protein [Helianthus anomalus]